MSTSNRLANRHIARLFDNLNKIADLSHLARSAIMQEMHWLAEDVERDVLRENKVYDKEHKGNEQNTEQNGTAAR